VESATSSTGDHVEITVSITGDHMEHAVSSSYGDYRLLTYEEHRFLDW